MAAPASVVETPDGRERRGHRDRGQEHTAVGTMDEHSDSRQRQEFAAHLNYLFAAHRRPDGLPYTLREVGLATGCALSYLTLLRTQRIGVLPEQARRERLATFFGAPATFFDAPLPDDAADVMAHDRAQVAAALRHVHLYVGPRGTSLDVISAGDQVLHFLAHARLIQEAIAHETETGAPAASLPARAGAGAPAPPHARDHAVASAVRRPPAWWRRLWPW